MNTTLPLLAAVCSLAMGVAEASHPPLKTVSEVDLNRYAGKWYQIAFFPTRFQKNCTLDTTAEYGVRSDGKVDVRNECTKPSGKRVSITGKAVSYTHLTLPTSDLV